VKRVLKIIAGSVLLFIGLVGLLLPVLPGWVFIIPGALLLGFDVAIIARYLRKAEDRWPQHRSWLGWLRSCIPVGSKKCAEQTKASSQPVE
jgi:uncharacterized membrane protein YbaN (DUF454 family)